MGITVLIVEHEKDCSAVLVELLSMLEIYPKVIVWWKAMSIAELIKTKG